MPLSHLLQVNKGYKLHTSPLHCVSVDSVHKSTMNNKYNKCELLSFHPLHWKVKQQRERESPVQKVCVCVGWTSAVLISRSSGCKSIKKLTSRFINNSSSANSERRKREREREKIDTASEVKRRAPWKWASEEWEMRQAERETYFAPATLTFYVFF